MTLDSSNSYVTLTEANAYFAARLYSDTWEDATDEEKEKVLLMSRRMLDLYMTWKGTPATSGQSLGWPRSGVSGLDSDEIPEAVKAAQLELALVLQGTDTTALPDGAGLSSMSAGPVNLVFNQETRVKVIPDHVVFMLSSLGSFRGEPSSFSVTR